jgi:hypothetical protein
MSAVSAVRHLVSPIRRAPPDIRTILPSLHASDIASFVFRDQKVGPSGSDTFIYPETVFSWQF